MAQFKTFLSFVVYSMCMVMLSVAGPIKKRETTNVAEFTMNSETHHGLNWDHDRGLQEQASASQAAFDTSECDQLQVSTKESDPIYKRSTCPWYYKVDHDVNRFPAYMLKAVPLCVHRCLGDGNEDKECSPILKDIVVLTKNGLDASNNTLWKETIERQPVGFTCTGRKIGDNVATQPPSDTPPLTDDYYMYA
ncbi:Interleukin-17 [Mactra antiquata]